MFRSAVSRRLTLPAIFLLLTSFGCSSAPVVTPPASRPPETVAVQFDAWSVDSGGMARLPEKDLRNILANRKRWIDYGKAREVGNGEH